MVTSTGGRKVSSPLSKTKVSAAHVGPSLPLLSTSLCRSRRTSNPTQLACLNSSWLTALGHTEIWVVMVDLLAQPRNTYVIMDKSKLPATLTLPRLNLVKLILELIRSLKSKWSVDALPLKAA